MKQRKLFAILTLVAFMMTLLPMAAFAAADYSSGASYTTIDKTSVKAGNEVKITLVTRTATGELVYHDDNTDSVEFYVKSSRDAETYTVEDNAGTVAVVAADAAKLAGMKVVAVPNANGEVIIKVKSSVSGEATISLYKEAELTKGAEKGLLIGQHKVEFTSSSSKVANATISAIEFSQGGTSYVVGGGTDPEVGRELTLKARLMDDKNNGVANTDVALQKSYDGGSWVTVETKETNALGRVEFKHTETKSGSYEFRLRIDGKNYSVTPVEYVAGDAVKIEAKAETKVVEAKATEQNVNFVVKDAYGNLIKTPGTLSAEYVRTPEDSDNDNGDTSGTISYDTDDKEFDVPFEFDEVGEYVVRAYISGTGIFAETKVEAKEKGDIVKFTVDFDDQKSLRAREDVAADTLALKVKEIDENGISFTITDASDYVISSSNVSLVKVASDFTLKGPDTNKDARGVATITLVHRELGTVQTIDVPVVGAPAAIEATVENTGAKTAKVTLQYVDGNGRNTYNSIDENYEFVGLGDAVVTNRDDFDADTGEATFNVEAANAGNYTFTVVSENNLAVVVSVNLTASKDEQPGANKVTLFIGQQVAVVDGDASVLDVAPFIKDGRTFVPVRFVAEALGAEVKFDAATQTVTATRGDDVVVLTIGSNVMTVNGEAQVTDVAPFIVDGRTVLPFRALAEAFGSEVAWDAATQSVVFEK